MLLKRLCLLFAFVLALPAAAIAQSTLLGGNPAHLIYFEGADESIADEPQIAIASNGDMYVAFAKYDDAGEARVFVLRSEDAGATWSEWAVFGSTPSAIDYTFPRLAIADRGTPNETLVVGYEQDSGGLPGYRVSQAIIPTATPTWSTETALSYNPSPFHPAVSEVDLVVGPIGSGLIAVAAVLDLALGEHEFRYNVKPDAATPFGTEILLHSPTPVAAPLSTRVGISVALHDAGGDDEVTVLLSHSISDFGGPALGRAFLTSALDFGTTGAFSPLDEIRTLDSTIQDLGLVSDPTGNELFALLRVSSETPELLRSDDDGATWSPRPLDGDPILLDLNLRWEPSGPVLLGKDSLGYVREYRYSGAANGTWSDTLVLQRHMLRLDYFCGADDPTQPGERVIVSLQNESISEAQGIWFNATWRGAPGYGVNKSSSPQSTLGETNSAPALGDVDGDGDLEIVATSFRSTSENYYVNLHHHTYANGASSLVGTDSTSAASSPALFDIDDDGQLEIFVGLATGGVLGLDSELGELQGWPTNFAESGDTWVSAGTVSGLVHGDVVAANANKVHLLNPGALERQSWPFVAPAGEIVGRAAIGDLEPDGETEVVAAFTTGVAVLASDGTLERFLSGPYAPSSGVTLVDLDGDNDLEIVVPTADGFVGLFHHDGTNYGPAWPYDSGSASAVSSVSVAEVAALGGPMLCFTSADQLFALQTDGTLATGYPVALGATGLSEPILGRTSATGALRSNLLVGDADGFTHVREHDGPTVLDWPHFYLEGPAVPPAIGDVDLDGINDIVIASGRAILVLDTGVAPAVLPSRRWSQAGHDAARSGCADCGGAIPTALEPVVGQHASLVSFAGARPNPNKGATSFAFSLSRRAHASLRVFDLRGRLVRELASGAREAGQHEIHWDGRDDRGHSVVAGTYFGRLEVVHGLERDVKTKALSIVR